jgi:hypothetical protein
LFSHDGPHLSSRRSEAAGDGYCTVCIVHTARKKLGCDKIIDNGLHNRYLIWTFQHEGKKVVWMLGDSLFHDRGSYGWIGERLRFSRYTSPLSWPWVSQPSTAVPASRYEATHARPTPHFHSSPVDCSYSTFVVSPDTYSSRTLERSEPLTNFRFYRWNDRFLLGFLGVGTLKSMRSMQRQRDCIKKTQSRSSLVEVLLAWRISPTQSL